MIINEGKNRNQLSYNFHLRKKEIDWKHVKVRFTTFPSEKIHILSSSVLPRGHQFKYLWIIISPQIFAIFMYLNDSVLSKKEFV